MSLDIGDVVLLKIPIIVSKVIGNKVECSWIVNGLKQTAFFNAKDLSKSPSQINPGDL